MNQCKYNKRNLLKWNVTLVINNLKLEFYSFRIEETAIRVSKYFCDMDDKSFTCFTSSRKRREKCSV